MEQRATGKRKLAAILSADVVGYSRLMGDDDAATVGVLKACRVVIRDLVERHHGRVVNTPGDSVLVEFPSAVEAVQAAVEIQKNLQGRNAELPAERRMEFRIGVNLGDVIEDSDGTLYGDGVNVAARVEALAEPGAICISGKVHEEVERRLDLSFESAGQHVVKNIAKPIVVYRINLDGRRVPWWRTTAFSYPFRRGRLVTATAAVLLIGAVIVVRQTTRERMPVDPVLAMPTGPVIAVLPFTNLSGDPGQEYFSDGLTEDIITELARFRDLYVLARNTTFQFKGQAVDVPAVSRKLGARYILEGSVSRSTDRVRISAQLIDSATGAHLWAERYDRRLSDIFAIQDEIAGQIVGTIASSRAGIIRQAALVASRKSPSQLEAYDHVLRATMIPVARFKESYTEGKNHLEQAVRQDPTYARARQEYAWWALLGWIMRWDPAPASPEEIRKNAIQAVELDPADPLNHRTAAWGYYFDKQFDLFEREAAITLNLAPNNAEILVQIGALFTFNGQYERGVPLVQKAYALNPSAAGGWYHSAIFWDSYRRGQYRKAIEVIRQHPIQGQVETQIKYVTAYGQLGEIDKAREHWKKCLSFEPNWSVRRTIEFMRFWNSPESLTQQTVEGLAKAGLRLEGWPPA